MFWVQALSKLRHLVVQRPAIGCSGAEKNRKKTRKNQNFYVKNRPMLPCGAVKTTRIARRAALPGLFSRPVRTGQNLLSNGGEKFRARPRPRLPAPRRQKLPQTGEFSQKARCTSSVPLLHKNQEADHQHQADGQSDQPRRPGKGQRARNEVVNPRNHRAGDGVGQLS